MLFRSRQAALAGSNAVVLGVSILDSASKAKFATKHGLNFPLLADADHVVAEAYGAWQERSMYGRKFMGVARITYLIAPDGRWHSGGTRCRSLGTLTRCSRPSARCSPRGQRRRGCVGGTAPRLRCSSVARKS